MQTLFNLFVQQLQDAYSAENQLVAALPQMAQAASSPELRAGFQQHLNETKNQIQRLEEVCRLLNCQPDGETCAAMQGLVEEGQEIISMDADPDVKDAGLICAAQKVEHYEIALYGCLCTWAEELALQDIKRLLAQNLDEEKRTDAKLTQLAEQRINLVARH